MEIRHLFRMKRPCSDCPFLKKGGIYLERGRIESIKSELMSNDERPFMCHKTTYATGGVDNEETGQYQPSGKESYCAGAMAFLHANNRANVAMRLGSALGMLDLNDLDVCVPLIDTSA